MSARVSSRPSLPSVSTPLVSILIPCYNAGRHLDAALESAFAQTWPHCEVILVNDGSTDDSGARAERFVRRGLKLIEQPNRGQCAAANEALRHARGDFIKFFDADDLMSPDMIARQVQALRGRADHVAYSEWARFFHDPSEAVFTPRAGWRDAAPVDWLVEIWADAQPMMQCAQFLVPRPLLDRVGGWDERLSLINDFEFFARIVTASAGVVFTPGAQLYYRSGLPTSLSRQRTVKAWESAFLSTTLGVGHLLRREESPRTRAAAAAVLQGLVYDLYPSLPRLVADLEARVAALGGTNLAPLGGNGFHLARRLVGWKLARRLQIMAGKYPRPTREP